MGQPRDALTEDSAQTRGEEKEGQRVKEEMQGVTGNAKEESLQGASPTAWPFTRLATVRPEERHLAVQLARQSLDVGPVRWWSNPPTLWRFR